MLEALFIAWLCAIAPSAGAHPVVAAAPGALGSDEASFGAALMDAQRLLRARRWSLAERAIRALLAAHAGADYVRPHLSGLREDLRRAAFWSGVDEPDLDELVSGELLDHAAGTGAIRIGYTREALADFERAGAARVHPMHFAGPWKIELEGSPSEVSSIALFVALGPRDGYLLHFGERRAGAPTFTPHSARRLRGEDERELGAADPVPRSDARAVRAEVEVRADAIRMRYAGRVVLELEKPEDAWGSFALVSTSPTGELETFGQLTLDGEAQRGWIDGLLDAAVSERRAAFDAAWSEPAELAAWGATPPGDAPDLDLRSLFAGVEFRFAFESPAQRERFAHARELLGRGRAQAAATLELTGAWPADTLPADALAFVRLQCALELDRPTLALDELERVRFAEGHGLERALLRADLLLRAGRLADARAAFEDVLEERPRTAFAHARAAEAELLLGEAESAHRTILRGLEVLPGSEQLRALERQVAKAARGPAWERAFEHRGRHFTVHTDADPRLAARASRTLDEAWQRCGDFFGRLSAAELRALAAGRRGAGPHSTAYVFSGRGSYATYVEDVADAGEGTLGIYSPLLKQVAAWNQPSEAELTDTLRHEAAHRYLDVVLGERVPRWLNEGLAECFAASWREDGTFAPGERMRASALATIREGEPLTPLRELFTQPESEFLRRPRVGYAQAWALTHFLRFGAAADRRLFDRIWKGLRAGDDPQAVLADALRGADVEDLQRRFLAWLDERAREG